METKLFVTLLFGFLLGMKHAIDADHIVAVSTIVSRSKNLLHACLVGLLWGIGHTLALIVAGILVLGLKLTITNNLALSLELLVGVLLIALGIPLVMLYIKNRKLHLHQHLHGNMAHLHIHSHSGAKGHHHSHDLRSLLVGIIHGMAGSAALMLIVLSTVGSFFEGFSYILFFGMGSILGMLILSSILWLALTASTNRFISLSDGLRLTAGLISIGLGGLIIFETGFYHGLFLGG